MQVLKGTIDSARNIFKEGERTLFLRWFSLTVLKNTYNGSALAWYFSFGAGA